MVRSNAERCKTCGQKILPKNPHRMDKDKVHVLMQMHRLEGFGVLRPYTDEAAGRDEARSVLQSRETGDRFDSIKNVREHVQRLHWFGLVDHHKKRNAGGYTINGAGVEFLRGRRDVPAIIWCRNGAVEVKSDKRVFISDIAGVKLDEEYWDKYPKRQKHQPAGASDDAVHDKGQGQLFDNSAPQHHNR